MIIIVIMNFILLPMTDKQKCLSFCEYGEVYIFLGKYYKTLNISTNK